MAGWSSSRALRMSELARVVKLEHEAEAAELRLSALLAEGGKGAKALRAQEEARQEAERKRGQLAATAPATLRAVVALRARAADLVARELIMFQNEAYTKGLASTNLAMGNPAQNTSTELLSINRVR